MLCREYHIFVYRMKKIIAILFLAIFSLQSFSVDVLQYILSNNLNVEEIHAHDVSKDGLQKGIKKEGFTSLLNGGFIFDPVGLLQSGKYISTSESFSSNLYFEISVPPPNCFA